MRRILHQCDRFMWVDLVDPTPDELAQLRQEFQLHPAFLQDCMDPIHLPKFERLGTTIFMILRMADRQAKKRADTIQELTRKVAIFVGPDFIITLHKQDPELFQAMIEKSLLTAADRQALDGQDQNKLSRVLVHFISRVLESYHEPLEKAEDELDTFEVALFSSETIPGMLQALHILRRRLGLIKRILIHSQDVIQKLSPPGEALSPMFQDLRETLSTLIFLTDELLEDATSLLNLEISISNQKTNEVMRVLTIFSVFFMPLNFVCGIYGMNFERMPELKWPWGYGFALGLMATITILIAGWFYRKGWLRSEQP